MVGANQTSHTNVHVFYVPGYPKKNQDNKELVQHSSNMTNFSPGEITRYEKCNSEPVGWMHGQGKFIISLPKNVAFLLAVRVVLSLASLSLICAFMWSSFILTLCGLLLLFFFFCFKKKKMSRKWCVIFFFLFFAFF